MLLRRDVASLYSEYSSTSQGPCQSYCYCIVALTVGSWELGEASPVYYGGCYAGQLQGALAVLPPVAASVGFAGFEPVLEHPEVKEAPASRLAPGQRALRKAPRQLRKPN